MSKIIKVYLQYPWKFPDSPYYQSLIENPPVGIEYLNAEDQAGVITNRRKFLLSNKLKKTIRGFLNSFKISLPNMHLSPEGDYDIIHCAHCLSKNKDTPWVADFEGVWQMFIGERTKRAKKKVKKILSHENCKAIIAWTDEAKEQISQEFPLINEKIKVIYPAIPVPKVKKRKHPGINLLFVGRYFYAKGGEHALEVMDRLTKKYKDVNGICVSETPLEIRRKYFANDRIKFYNIMPQEKLFKNILSMADIFVYPGYSDSFGFSFLEAMSFGIPVVTVDGFARKEIIENRRMGFVVKRPKMSWKNGRPLLRDQLKTFRSFEEKIELLITDKNLRKNMSKKSTNLIKDGKFSIKHRNGKLEKIYRDTLS